MKPYHTRTSHHNGLHEPGDGCEACCDCILCAIRYYARRMFRRNHA